MNYYKDEEGNIYQLNDMQVGNGYADELIEITEEEALAASNPVECLDDCKIAAATAMRSECDLAIESLFTSKAIGSDKTYSYDCREVDQDNLKTMLLVGSGGDIYVHDGISFNDVSHTHEQALMLLTDMQEHIRIQRFDKLKPLIALINAATTREELEAITWDSV